jgi:acyl-coenzyme A thioesterase 13
MGLEDARARFDRMPYVTFLGIELMQLSHEYAVIRLPFDVAHTNQGGVINGGATATLMQVAGTLAAWSGIDLQSNVYLSSVDLSVQYLAAAIDEDVIGAARVLRRGRDLFFLQTDVHTQQQQPICQGLMIYRAPHATGQARRMVAQPHLLPALAPSALPNAKMGLGRFVDKLQVTSRAESRGRACLHMPCTHQHTDAQGHLHDGALAALLDIAGTAAAWSLVKRQGSRGATIGLQLSFHNPTGDPVVADAQVQQRSEELFFSTVQITSEVNQQLVATGQVSYRIIEPA